MSLAYNLRYNYYATYVCLVEGSGGTPVPVDMLLIKFRLGRQNARRLSTDHPRLATFSNEEILSERDFIVPLSNFKLLSERPRWTKRLASYLSHLDVPLDEHPDIIKDIFTMAEGENVVPGGVTSIYAVIADTCVHVIEDESSVESSTTHMYQDMLMTPAAKSCLGGLEKVRVDDDVIRETPSCVICHDNIDHFDNNAAKEEEERVIDLDPSSTLDDYSLAVFTPVPWVLHCPVAQDSALMSCMPICNANRGRD